MTTVKLISIFLLISSPRISLALDWQHRPIEGADGVEVQIDYQVVSTNDGSTKPTKSFVAENLYVNVRGEVSSDDRVTVVFENKDISHSNSSGSYYSTPITYEMIDLPWQENHFSARVDSAQKVYQSNFVYRDTFVGIDGRLPKMIIREAGYGGIRSYKQKISVVINGKRVVDSKEVDLFTP